MLLVSSRSSARKYKAAFMLGEKGRVKLKLLYLSGVANSPKQASYHPASNPEITAQTRH